MRKLFTLLLSLALMSTAHALTLQVAPQPGNCAPAINEALQKLSAAGGGTLQLAPGRYVCLPYLPGMADRPGMPGLLLRDASNVVLEGHGATLVGQGVAGLFAAQGCRNVTLRDLKVVWEPLPHSSGRVVRVLPELDAYDIEPQVPAAPQAGRIVQGILAYDPIKHRLAENGWEIYQTQGERDADKTLVTPEGYLRLFQKHGTPLPQVGWFVVARHQVYGSTAFYFGGCSRVNLQNVVVHAVPGMAVIGQDSRDISIDGIKVVPEPGGWMSATADAMHFNGCRGTITVQNSEFAGMGDDAINIHGMYGRVMERKDDRTLVVARARLHPYYDKEREAWAAPLPGDTIEFGNDPEPLLAGGQFTVATAATAADIKRTILTSTEALPADVKEGAMLWNLSTSPAVRISNCTVRGNRARGLLLQTRDVVVENCTFEDVSGAGIQICTDAAEWWESLPSRNVTVKNCSFTRCNFGVARRKAALDIFSDLPDHRQSAAGVHSGLRLIANTFSGNSGAAIHIGSARDVEVRGNTIQQTSGPAILVVNSQKITVTGNALSGGASGVERQGTTGDLDVILDKNPGWGAVTAR